VQIVNADIVMAIAEATSTYDLVLLDVDNGPGYLVHDTNAALYRPPALSSARAALRSGGALVVWSASPAPELEDALREVFGNAEELPQQVLLQDRDEQYWLYVARA
jgi:spermidine synthase